LEEETRTNSRDIGNLQESLVRVLTARDIKDKINRVGNQVQYWNLQESLVRVGSTVSRCLFVERIKNKSYNTSSNKSLLKIQPVTLSRKPPVTTFR
jgi:hypothetical protein